MVKKWLILGLTLCAGPLSAANAATLQTPDGNPTGTASARSDFGISALSPGAAAEMGSNAANTTPLQLFLIAMDAQGFNKANGYSFTTGSLANNDLTLRTYSAVANGPVGGADFRLSYTATGNDPTNIRWIQVVETSTRTFVSPGTTADPFHRGLSTYVDDGLNPRNNKGMPISPFYDTSGSANRTSFADAPRLLFDPDRNPVIDHFYTFVVAQNRFNPKKTTLYDVVEWGFKLTYVPRLFSFTSTPTPDRVLQGNKGSGTITVSNNTDFPLTVTKLLGPQPVIGKLNGGDQGDSILNPKRDGGTLEVGTVLAARGNAGSSGTIIESFDTFDNRKPDPNVDSGYWNIGNLVGVRATVPVVPAVPNLPSLSYPYSTKVDAPVEVYDPAPAPEPASVVLLATGLAGLCWWRRRLAA
jgi:hypothetical protein